MLGLLANALVIAGICILIFSLIQTRRIIITLPYSQVRQRWYILAGLIVLFIGGYFGYIVDNWGRYETWTDLIVPGVFFFAAGFALLTVSLSLQTAFDIRRVTLLEQENITDYLMGIYNRRYLDRRLEEECARSRRYNLPISVLLIDVDHFKHINDTYGHQTGDVTLKTMSTLVLEMVRETDIVARYGGEEIAIIAPNTPPSLASVLAERLRQHIEQHELLIPNGANRQPAIRITVSIGVAAGLNQEARNSKLLVRKADKALYQAKQTGRNRIVIYEKNAHMDEARS